MASVMPDLRLPSQPTVTFAAYGYLCRVIMQADKQRPTDTQTHCPLQPIMSSIDNSHIK